MPRKVATLWYDSADAGALDSIHLTGPDHLGVGGRGVVGLVNGDRLRRILSRMLDENEFLSPYGIRALSRYHEDHPYVFSRRGVNSREVPSRGVG